MQEKKEMTTKLRPSYADSVTATSWSPRPKAWVGTTTAHRAGFITRADTFTKPCVVGGSGLVMNIIKSVYRNLKQHTRTLHLLDRKEMASFPRLTTGL